MNALGVEPFFLLFFNWYRKPGKNNLSFAVFILVIASSTFCRYVFNVDAKCCVDGASVLDVIHSCCAPRDCPEIVRFGCFVNAEDRCNRAPRFGWLAKHGTMVSRHLAKSESVSAQLWISCLHSRDG